MTSANRFESMDSIADVVGHVRRKGVRLWAENGELRYKAPRGALTPKELERLKESKGQIVALLERTIDRAGNAAKHHSAQQPLAYARASFSQIAHWHLYHLAERKSVRQIGSATRLRGRLDIDALRRSVEEIIRRQDALRTRIVVLEGAPTQAVFASIDYEWEMDDLRMLPENQQHGEIQRHIEQLMLWPIDVAVDPLFGLRLLRLQDEEHVLIVAMEHMISDAYSMGIFLRELVTAYGQTSKGLTISLPEISVQFSDYTNWQRASQAALAANHGASGERLQQFGRIRFPEEQSVPLDAGPGWKTVPVCIGPGVKAELREWCRQRCTTIAMSVFTAYVALVMRWCGVSEVVIGYVTDGRVHSKVANTIGYFASAIYLRIDLAANDTFVDLMARATAEYCRAYEHADFSYKEAQVPRPDFTRNAGFNWVPQSARKTLGADGGSNEEMTWSPIPFEHPMIKILEWDAEPVVVLYDGDEEITGGIHFPRNRFSTGSMERFQRNFVAFTRALIEHPEQRIQDITLV